MSSLSPGGTSRLTSEDHLWRGGGGGDGGMGMVDDSVWELRLSDTISGVWFSF